jgi:hypothetical protein
MPATVEDTWRTVSGLVGAAVTGASVGVYEGKGKVGDRLGWDVG